MALASRSKSVPVVARASHQRPTATAVRFGASFVRETLPPLVKLTPIQVSFREEVGGPSTAVEAPGSSCNTTIMNLSDLSHPAHCPQVCAQAIPDPPVLSPRPVRFRT